MRRSTCLPAAAARDTSESRKLQSKADSLGSRSAQSWRMLTPSTSGFCSTFSAQGCPAAAREKTPLGTAARSGGPKRQTPLQSDKSIRKRTRKSTFEWVRMHHANTPFFQAVSMPLPGARETVTTPVYELGCLGLRRQGKNV